MIQKRTIIALLLALCGGKAHATFNYDAQDRLTQAGNLAMTYSADGNILSKTNIGQYYYDGAKPHAVTSIDNDHFLVSDIRQTATYNSCGKVTQIQQTDSLTLQLSYGPDGERWRGSFLSGGQNTTMLYLGDYEEVTTPQGTKSICYLDGGVMAIRESNVPLTLYVPITDNLGSITRIYNGSGTLVFRAAYDAWGNQTVYNNSIGFHRGYCGHEMLPDFSLINMNGRLYDPLLGRFLSTDNFVQEPYDSQNFNRYSYCLNNPLKYTDPSGELAWFIPVIAGAIIGAYTGASIQSHTAAFWNWSSDCWKGAIAGSIVGASLGYSFAGAIGATGMTDLSLVSDYTFMESTTKVAGTTSSILNSGTIGIGLNTITDGDWDGAWKAGITGLVSGTWAASGGFGMVSAWKSRYSIAKVAGKLGYQMIGTTLGSVGSNWTVGEPLFSKITLGVGPINLTIGKKQKLLQWQNNIGNIGMHTFGLINTAFGGSVSFDKMNLSINYKGGIIDRFYNPNQWTSGFSPHVITGNSRLKEVYEHELHHLWQSRSFNDVFLLNYGLQGFNALLMGGSFVDKYNYYEDYINTYNTKWW